MFTSNINLSKNVQIARYTPGVQCECLRKSLCTPVSTSSGLKHHSAQELTWDRTWAGLGQHKHKFIIPEHNNKNPLPEQREWNLNSCWLLNSVPELLKVSSADVARGHFFAENELQNVAFGSGWPGEGSPV